MPNTTFSIEMTVLTKDKLRRIYFKLSKDLVQDTEDKDHDEDKEEVRVNWRLDFAFDERAKATDKFTEEHNVKLVIDISKELESKAEATLQEGFDDAQASAALTAGQKFKLWKSNKISEKSFKNSAVNVVARHGA